MRDTAHFESELQDEVEDLEPYDSAEIAPELANDEARREDVAAERTRGSLPAEGGLDERAEPSSGTSAPSHGGLPKALLRARLRRRR